MDKNCETCKHWFSIDDGMYGECRHMPPKIVDSIAGNDRSEDWNDSIYVATRFPITSEDTLCGMWTPKPEVKP